MFGGPLCDLIHQVVNITFISLNYYELELKNSKGTACDNNIPQALL
jgi:hypothetical protein